MPGTVTTIDREQREGLYELIRNHLGSIRLLEDIGWAERDERETFELTMPAHDLMELLQRLHAEAVPVLVETGAEAQSSRDDAETDRRFQLGYEVCNKLLDELDPREADRGRAERLRRGGSGPVARTETDRERVEMPIGGDGARAVSREASARAQSPGADRDAPG